MKQPWFINRDWEFVVAMNAGLCQSGNALHKPTTEGYEETKAFWNQNYQRELTLTEAVEICRQCHRMAPFCNFNGNTFVAIIRDCIAHTGGLSNQQTALAKSLAGHMVAGTAAPEEVTQFNQLLQDIEHGVTTAKTLQPGSYRVGDGVQTPKGTLTGLITEVHGDGSIRWKCDQTGAEMTGTPNSLKPYQSN